MKKLLLLLLSTNAYAFEFMALDKAYVDYAHYTWAREPFLAQAGFVPTDKIDLHVDLNLLSNVVFFQNMVHSEMDKSQYRLIGWNYKLGVHVNSTIDLFFEHYSQHILDAPTVSPNTFDAIGFRIYLYKQKD